MNKFISRKGCIIISRMMSSTTAAPSLLVHQKNKLLTIELNRPKALNALNVEMCQEITTLLRNRINADSSDVGAFIVKGAGGKAFCAGGDVKSIWQKIKDKSVDPSQFKDI